MVATSVWHAVLTIDATKKNVHTKDYDHSLFVHTHVALNIDQLHIIAIECMWDAHKNT